LTESIQAKFSASREVRSCLYRVAQKNKLLYCVNSLLFLSRPVYAPLQIYCSATVHELLFNTEIDSHVLCAV